MSAFDPTAISPTDALRPELSAGESLLWAGRPRPRLDVLRHGPGTVLFTVLWLGFVAFWEVTAVTEWRNRDGPFFFVLFGAGFFILGLNGMVGAQMRALRRLKHTTYGVTDRRLLFLHEGGGKRQLHSLDLDRIGGVDKQAHADGSGSIVFEPGSVAARLLSTGPMRGSRCGTRGHDHHGRAALGVLRHPRRGCRRPHHEERRVPNTSG